MSSQIPSGLASPALRSPDLAPVVFRFQNSYARLPERFYARLPAASGAAPSLVKLNENLARTLGLDPATLGSTEGVEVLAGRRIAEGSEPLAMAYAGHQFGSFVAQLGDGRANLLGEVLAPNGVRYDIQLKGSGPTPFSRGGDGRAALGPVLREYIVSEAMAALGVPTTRALAVVATGEPVLREAAFPGAVLTRVASSHLRVGTFQYFAARGDVEGVRTLADYAMRRHFPEALESPRPYRALLDAVVAGQARLVAQWMLFGFVHGVMNTDNTTISGETIDYGPCAFMEAYDPDTVFSSIDQRGRYAYSNQPNAALWNLTRLAEALLPCLEQEASDPEMALASAQEALSSFAPQFQAARVEGLRHKVGLFTAREGDAELVEDLLQRMAANGADFTLTFRNLCDAAAGPAGDDGTRALFRQPAAYDQWAARWRARSASEQVHGTDRVHAMRNVNPLYIPRNHRVEHALNAAVMQGDLRPFEGLLEVLAKPYEDRSGLEAYAHPARPHESVLQTFCGT